jgi:hypothetical protein
VDAVVDPQTPGEPVLLTIGDMAVTQTRVVAPSGTYPLAGTVWIASNNTVTTEAIPAVAIVLCILFVWFCLLGLLFLLMKERRTVGYVQVSVQGHGFYHVTQIPVGSPMAVVYIEQQVNYVRGLVAAIATQGHQPRLS